ncbi:MAG: hypothetical protein LBP55_03865 [Candidatus Adiutrix sp.]|jgi:hypothetical protein|nr:hypothetical protein [Candidatus Adiutrix sp.]
MVKDKTQFVEDISVGLGVDIECAEALYDWARDIDRGYIDQNDLEGLFWSEAACLAFPADRQGDVDLHALYSCFEEDAYIPYQSV